MSGAAQKIHILGLGSIGTFVAHSLRCLPKPPPVTLLLHRKSLYQEYASKDGKIRLQVGEQGIPQEQHGFEFESMNGSAASSDPIDHLMVCVKASATVSSLEPLKHRLGRNSTICFFQNGMGQIEELNERIFKNHSTRPDYLSGIVRHGVYMKSPTEAVLSGVNGCIEIGRVPSKDSTSTPPSSQFLLDHLLRSPALRCTKLDWTDLLHVQLLKLATNCVLNPLTALLDVRNGEIKSNPAIAPLGRSLIKEISLVLESLSEFKNLAGDSDRFSPTTLEKVMLDTVEKTASNSSSMREDILKGRATEIEYMNGWIVDQGAKLGIHCPTNEFVTNMVLAKSRHKPSGGL
ncbi:uncharacterized protein N7529_007792 [Penicillium soppii]|jgi:2-dehydropantoate 2-reductase|uniref:uncharacterized protein n=1 Tax=Penicillium soppii TaxID=69789 RepID=UPI0025492826|nr:uncharacterized protein N7529_007792 [Penicillium soppii]KAJ5860482.1 hypothetical protein N7529_007792 [Penicillium soppii]